MTALASQAQAGLRLVEFALGDLWNNSGDGILNASSIVDNALMIPNLGRFLGSTRHTSPRVPSLPNITRYTFKFTNFAGYYTAQLDFPILLANATWTWAGTGAPAGAPEATLSDVDATGKWYIEKISGQCWFYDYIRADWTLTYEPVVVGDSYEDATFNIIPDLDTDASYAFQGIKIQYANGVDNSQGYYIYLPPRGPLDNRRAGMGPQDDIHVPAHTGNFDTTPTVAPYYMWQSDAVVATITAGLAEHYRYNLPVIITDNWSQAARLPDGLVYLWDPTGSGTILTGLTLTAENAVTPKTWMFVASGTALDTYLATTTGLSKYPVASLQSTSHAIGMYPSGGLRVVTVGTGVAQSLSQLWTHFLNHSHDWTSVSPTTRFVSHGNLIDCYYADDDIVPGEPVFHPTGLINDWHPQYLHRKGLQNGRDRFKGGMLGDIFMCGLNPGSDYDNLTGDSCGIRFGDSVSGPKLFFDADVQGLSVNPSGTALRLATADSVYVSGVITTKSFWVGIEPGSMDSSLWLFVGAGLSTNNPAYWYNNSGGWADLSFFINDWPEGMSLNALSVDIELGAGTVAGVNIYFYRQTWALGASVITGFGSPSGTDKVTTGATTTRQQVSYQSTSSINWHHEEHKLAVFINPCRAGTKFYGIRLNASWHSVNKWAPVPVFY